jgi:hypothetical protein
MATTLKGTEELVNHYGLVRLRCKGSANLVMTLFSLDSVENFQLAPITLSVATNIEPTQLSNFTQQRAMLEIRTLNLGEKFQISKVVVFSKPVANSFPM